MVWHEFLGSVEYVECRRFQTNQVAFLRNLEQTVASLQGIAEKELAQQPLTSAEVEFLRRLIEYNKGGCLPAGFTGWYPGLFYRNLLNPVPYGLHQGADEWDALVTDVHTDTPSPDVGDPGSVLHEAVGNVHLLLMAVDNGPDRMVYAGPVLSHYEFELPLNQRESDAQWKTEVRAGKLPPHPEWTRGYLVPGPYQVPPEVP